MSNDNRKTVGLDDVLRALQIREGGGSWAQVIEATGFNGATLRPHIVKVLASKERLNRAPVEKGDRVDSPYAHVEPVELSKDSIIAARKRGMAWYSIANALGISEAKVRALGGEEAAPRVYGKKAVKPADKPVEVKPSPEEVKEAKRVARNAAAKAKRDAKKAAAKTA